MVELKIDNGNSPQIEANTDRPHIETGRSVEVVEVKDDGEKPRVEAKEDHAEELREKPQFEVKEVQSKEKRGNATLQNEAKVSSQNEENSSLENNSSINNVSVSSKNGAKFTLDKIAEMSNKNVDNVPIEGPTSLADLLKDDDEMNKPMPKFETISEELKWKFNKARNDLKKAKQIVQLAEHIAKKKHKGTSEEQSVKDIITKTEVAMVHAGEKMGLDYMHYRRRRSIDDDEDEFE